MSSTIAEPVQAHPRPFANEPVADFSKSANREAMEQALRDVRAQFGREYDLLIAGRREKTRDKLKSLNPSRPSEVVGVHIKGHRGAGEGSGGSGSRVFSGVERGARRRLARGFCCAPPTCFANASSNSTRGWSTKPARPGRKRTPTFPRRSISANTTRARCCAWPSRIRWCSCRARRTSCSTCRWAWAWSCRRGIFRWPSWWA